MNMRGLGGQLILKSFCRRKFLEKDLEATFFVKNSSSIKKKLLIAFVAIVCGLTVVKVSGDISGAIAGEVGRWARLIPRKRQPCRP